MATGSVSGTRSAGAPVSRPGASNATRDSQASAGRQRARSASSSEDPGERQYIHLDGRSFDRYAPRGTYVNILV
ncbi:MAG: hypothetical protein F8N37_02030 [Telmatospirillum sp.]|nr:hypothetical protein [Telmatospirillum sp.]